MLSPTEKENLMHKILFNALREAKRNLEYKYDLPYRFAANHPEKNNLAAYTITVGKSDEFRPNENFIETTPGLLFRDELLKRMFDLKYDDQEVLTCNLAKELVAQCDKIIEENGTHARLQVSKFKTLNRKRRQLGHALLKLLSVKKGSKNVKLSSYDAHILIEAIEGLQ